MPIMNDQESLQSAIDEDVRLHDYDASWPEMFVLERDRLQSLFPGQFAGIQHIGSTAVPGLQAKPIIDIMAGVESMAVARALSEALCKSGYTTSAEFNETLTDRQWFMRWTDGHRTHHLHVLVHGAAPWRERLQFRDALRTQPKLAARYVALKMALAAQHRMDRQAYTDAKLAFIQSCCTGE